MTIRQKVLKLIYPLWSRYSGLLGAGYKQSAKIKAPVSFHTLAGILNDGSVIRFSDLKGKPILIVNTASDCGYTAQLNDLEKLHQQYHDKIKVIAFPSNDFREQEKGSDEEIALFCKNNFNVSFPLMKKGSVKKSENQEPVFQWLSTKELNGWNDKPPPWNFSKYIIDENGNLTHLFGPAVNPLGKEIKKAMNL